MNHQGLSIYNSSRPDQLIYLVSTDLAKIGLWGLYLHLAFNFRVKSLV